MQKPSTQPLPNFIVKSTLGVTLASALLLVPFTFNNFLQGRTLLGSFTLMTIMLCALNARLGFAGQYSLKLNLFVLAPTFTLAIGLAIYQLGVAGSYWAPLALLALYFILPKKQAWITSIIYMIIIAPIAWSTLEPALAFRFFAVLLGTSLFAFLSINEIYKQQHLLTAQAVTDSLTGLYNRSLLQSTLESAIHQSARSKYQTAILMFDIDHFKRINDQFGHDTGDAVLKATGTFLTEYFRTSDMVFRVGGEEFLALLYNTDGASALGVAERLRSEFEQLSLIPHQTITISIGISSLLPEMDWKQWMKQSDENLYQAKSSGRNQVIS